MRAAGGGAGAGYEADGEYAAARSRRQSRSFITPDAPAARLRLLLLYDALVLLCVCGAASACLVVIFATPAGDSASDSRGWRAELHQLRDRPVPRRGYEVLLQAMLWLGPYCWACFDLPCPRWSHKVRRPHDV